MDAEVLNRYFQGRCSAEEMLVVAEWFKSPEGQIYLSSRLDEDISLASANESEQYISDSDSEKLLNKIMAAKEAIDIAPFTHVENTEGIIGKKTGQKRLDIFPLWARYAAIVTGVLLLAFSFWKTSSTETISEKTAFGETKTVILPDGSTVILNGNSSLHYQTDFHQAEIREVWLDGEAFFSIAHLPKNQKFIVNTSDNFNVEVLGTTFNVLTREQKTKVVLNTGKIKLNIRPDESREEHLVMNPGELVEFDNLSTTYIKRRVNPEAHSSWKSKKMIFENTSLSEILLLLEHTYGLQVEVADTSLLSQKLNGTIPTENVEVLLEGLSHVFSLKITRDNQKVIIENQ
jgi:ferric-dicitrate binding protein FerR (iron transport regulator)